MKNRIAVILMALTALTFSSCDKPEVPSAFLEVTPNNIAGTWVLESFCGVPQAEGNYVYLEILRKDRTFKIFQNTDSAYTRVLTGSYNIYTDNEAGSVIRGMYDYQQGYWASRYVIKNLTSTQMCWEALDDPTNVCVYVRADIPHDIYSAYVPDVEEKE
ncbi:MAG: lipocalin family protein [Alistipes sp.]|nr:lipocalin family protein [Alistipes sp.]